MDPGGSNVTRCAVSFVIVWKAQQQADALRFSPYHGSLYINLGPFERFVLFECQHDSTSLSISLDNSNYHTTLKRLNDEGMYYQVKVFILDIDKRPKHVQFYKFPINDGHKYKIWNLETNAFNEDCWNLISNNSLSVCITITDPNAISVNLYQTREKPIDFCKLLESGVEHDVNVKSGFCQFPGSRESTIISTQQPRSGIEVFRAHSKADELEEKFFQTFRQNEYAPCIDSLSSDFCEMRISEADYDVVLKSRSRQFPAHKAVLSSHSKVFLSMFQNNMAETSNGVVELVDIHPFDLEQFLKYIYSGKVYNLTEESIIRLYEIADKYAVDSLMKKCSTFLLDVLTPVNAWGYLLLADSYNDFDFKESVLRYIIQRKDILKSKNWGEIFAERPKLCVELFRAHVHASINH